MIRNIVHIDEDKCTGCGLCAEACHEGAIGMVNGKARLLRDDYCDGLGDCLPACPADAISIIQREADAYDEAAVIANQMAQAKMKAHAGMPATGCPGSMAKTIERAASTEGVDAEDRASVSAADDAAAKQPSRLGQWPVQIKLAPVNAPYFAGADLLIAADCCAFAYGSFHEDFIDGRICLVGCPKLDGVDYAEKLGAICAGNDIRSITVTRMEVPCCGGIEHAARRAADARYDERTGSAGPRGHHRDRGSHRRRRAALIPSLQQRADLSLDAMLGVRSDHAVGDLPDGRPPVFHGDAHAHHPQNLVVVH